MSADLDTRIEGTPAKITAVATWLRGTLAPALTTFADDVSAQRRAVQGEWQGDLADAFDAQCRHLTKVTDDIAATIKRGAATIDTLAGNLTKRQDEMRAVLTYATAGGLGVSGTRVLHPGPVPQTPAILYTFETPENQAERAAAQAKIDAYNAMVATWNECVAREDKARRGWDADLAEAADDWTADQATLASLTGALVSAGIQLEVLRRWMPVLTRDVDEMFAEADELLRRADELRRPGDKIADGARERFYELTDRSQQLRHDAQVKKAKLPNWELPKGLTRGLLVIDVATTIYSIKSDMDDGESAGQAVTSNVGGSLAGIGASIGAGAYIGGAVGTFVPIPGVGTAAGVVLGSAVGLGVGVFTSGAIDSLWESGADSVSDVTKAIGDGIRDVADVGVEVKDFFSSVFK